jgi:hypothetical protein
MISAPGPSVRRYLGAVIDCRVLIFMYYMFGNSLPFIYLFIYFYLFIFFSGRKEYLHPQ